MTRHLRLAMAAALAATLASPAPSARAEGPACVIKTKKGTWDKLKVSITGEDDLKVAVEGWPMKATIQAGDGEAFVDVDGPLRFEGFGAVEDLPLAPTGTVTVRDGMLTLGRKARLTARRATASGTLNVKAAWGPAASVDNVVVPCGQLDIRPEQGAATAVEPTGEGLVSKTGTLTLYPKPKAKDGLLVRGPVAFVKAKKKGPWVKLEARWDDGSRLAGWAKVADVKESLFLGGHAGFSGGGGCGQGGVGTLSEAWLDKDAVIHSRAKGPSWARTTRRVKATVVGTAAGGSEYLRVYELDGIVSGFCGTMERAWVRREAVEFVTGK